MSLELTKLKGFIPRKGPVLFVIMDGVGIGRKDKGDCVYNAKTPNLEKLKKWSLEKGLYTTLKAHGTAVGLPSDKEMGNSEVGHNALGAGRVFNQGAKLVNTSIEDRTIFTSPLWKKLTSISDDNAFHLIGLTSDGYVHSHINHLYAFLDELAQNKVKHVRVHTLLDGRDVPAQSALDFIIPLEKKMKKLNEKYEVDFMIASGGGRMRVTMDRYNSDWKVVKRGWDAHVCGIAEEYEGYKGYFSSAEDAILKARELDKELIDQFLPSFVVVDDNNKAVGKMQDGDSVVFFNYRGDRAIQISRAFEELEFNEFNREYYPKVEYAGLLEYDGDLKIPKQYLVPPPSIDKTIGEYLCNESITQFACAETHKFGHVTYFWNGNKSGYINKDLEKYVEMKSDPAELIEERPDMKALEVTNEVIKALDQKKYKFLRTNLANGDMVGHTGSIPAVIKAVETVDNMIGKLMKKIEQLEGVMIVSADHGNAEEMIDKKGRIKTSHTTNLVPFFIWDPKYSDDYKLSKEVEDPQLANIASTIFNFLGYNKPEEYLNSLIKIVEE